MNILNLKGNCIFITLPIDLKRVKELNLEKYDLNIIYCSKLEQLKHLKKYEHVIYVFTKYSHLATSFQEMVLELIPCLGKEHKQWVMKLDNVPIYVGLKELRGLPEINIKMTSKKDGGV